MTRELLAELYKLNFNTGNIKGLKLEAATAKTKCLKHLTELDWTELTEALSVLTFLVVLQLC